MYKLPGHFFIKLQIADRNSHQGTKTPRNTKIQVFFFAIKAPWHLSGLPAFFLSFPLALLIQICYL